MLTKRKAEELYDKLQKAYSPTYYPSAEEKSEVIFKLQHMSDLNEEFMISQIEKLAILHADHKTKVTTLITNKFWEQKLNFGVQSNRFKPEN